LKAHSSAERPNFEIPFRESRLNSFQPQADGKPRNLPALIPQFTDRNKAYSLNTLDATGTGGPFDIS
jgi:hypothetical protein